MSERIYGYADPRVMKRDDLVREHRHCHEIGAKDALEVAEVARFWKNRVTVSALIMRHELIRVTLNYRYPGHHKIGVHPTPMRRDLLVSQHKAVIREFARECAKDGVRQSIPLAPHVWEANFYHMMKSIEFPPSFEHADTPWEERHQPLPEYLRENPWIEDERVRKKRAKQRSRRR